MPEIVECRSEFTYAEQPVALTWNGLRLEITAVLAGWRTPHGPAFRVCTRDGQIFELAYDEAAEAWRVRQL